MPCSLDEWYRWVDQFSSHVLLDGGLGELLAKRGNDIGTGSLWSGRLLVTDPNELTEVASLWLKSGSDVITTATYQVSAKQIQTEFELSENEAESIIHSSVTILNDARLAFWTTLSKDQRDVRRYPKVGASMGPYSAVLPDTDEYSGTYSGVMRSDFLDFHASRCCIFDKLFCDPHATHCDIYCFETIGSMDESMAIVEVMGHQTRASVPFWISFQCRDSEQIACREKLSVVIENVLRACSTKNLVAIGVNCVSVNDVKNLIDIAKESVRSFMSNQPNHGWKVDLIAYPNTGEVWTEDGWIWHENLPTHDDRSWADVVYTSGARLVGGCCRIGLSEIEALHVMRSTTN